jgi:hypothetical protein
MSENSKRYGFSKSMENLLLVLISLKHPYIKENRSYGMFGKNKVSLPHSDRTSGLGCVRPPCNDKPYVGSRYRKSTV